MLKSISCFCDFDLQQTTNNVTSYFLNIHLICNISPHLKIKYVPSADFYEIRNTATHKFAFCDCTLIVAPVTLQEPYFPNMYFHISVQKTLFYFWNMLSYIYTATLTMKICFENAQKSPLSNSETPTTLQSMDKYRGFPNYYITMIFDF